MKRNLFAEISEGFGALADERSGKQTLRTTEIELKPAPKIERASCWRYVSVFTSRALYWRAIRANPRTLENWEQGRAKPNAQAALLIRLVEKYRYRGSLADLAA